MPQDGALSLFFFCTPERRLSHWNRYSAVGHALTQRSRSSRSYAKRLRMLYKKRQNIYSGCLLTPSAVAIRPGTSGSFPTDSSTFHVHMPLFFIILYIYSYTLNLFFFILCAIQRLILSATTTTTLDDALSINVYILYIYHATCR